MYTYDRETKAWNWEKYVAWHVKYHVILGIFVEYGHQGLDLESKVQYLLNGVRCDKLSTAVPAAKVHPDKYEKDFNTVVSSLHQYIDKKASTSSVKDASVSQSRPPKWQMTSTTHGTIKGNIELKKYFRKEHDSMLIAQHQQLYELQKKSQAH